MKSRLYIVLGCLFACSGAPARDVPRSAPRDAAPSDTAPSDAAFTTEPDAADDEPLACEPYDEKNPACRDDPRACTVGHAYCKCPSPPDVENPACWAVMPCPRVPDRRVRACRPAFPTCSVDRPDPKNPDCPPLPVFARVIRAETLDGKTIVTVAIGTHTVSKHWKATLLRADSDEALAGGELTIIRMSSKATVAKVSVTVQTVRDNPRVRLEPP